VVGEGGSVVKSLMASWTTRASRRIAFVLGCVVDSCGRVLAFLRCCEGRLEGSVSGRMVAGLSALP
jgi:hypothetical protein